MSIKRTATPLPTDPSRVAHPLPQGQYVATAGGVGPICARCRWFEVGDGAFRQLLLPCSYRRDTCHAPAFHKLHPIDGKPIPQRCEWHNGMGQCAEYEVRT